MWKLKKVTVVPVVIGALGVVFDMFDKRMEKLGTTISLSSIAAQTSGGPVRLKRESLTL